MFQQTVNLKDKMEKERQKRLALQNLQMAREDLGRRTERTGPERKESERKELNSLPASSAASRAQAIDKVYGAGADDKNEAKKKNEFQKISRPAVREPFFTKARLVYFILAGLVAILATSVYFNIQNFRASRAPADVPAAEARWYLVKLVNGEAFYGKIADTQSDPIILSVVYYDYDQMNKEKDADRPERQEAENLRLVKRGKEAHGPDGTLALVRAQVVFLEPLSDDSRVLKAILENEK